MRTIINIDKGMAIVFNNMYQNEKVNNDFEISKYPIEDYETFIATYRGLEYPSPEIFPVQYNPQADGN